MDLDDIWSGDLSLTKAATLARHLPPEAAIYRGEAWSDTNQLLALMVDILNILAWQKTKDGQKGNKKPKPIPRPGDERREKQRIDKANAKADAMASKFGSDGLIHF